MSAMNFSKTPLALILGGLLLSGCAVGPDFLRPDSTLPEQYTETSGDQAAQVTTDAAINPEWWRLFEDEILNNLVQQSLENSQDLQAAVARLEAAEAAAREAGSSLFPSVDLTGNTVRNRASGETASGQQTGPLIYNDRRVALTISYELDLWGRIRRNTEAAEALAKASQFDRDVVRLTLTSQVTQTYLNLRSLDAQLQVS
ncbi:MAG: TolC family protein, partial [Azovibrio sp.]